MYDPTRPAALPGQMQTTSMPQGAQGWRSGGMNLGGFPAFPQGGMTPPARPGMGGGGFTPPQMPDGLPQMGGVNLPQMGQVPQINPANMPQRPMHPGPGGGGGGGGPFDVQGYINALQGWVGNRPDDQSLRRDWRGEMPSILDFRSTPSVI